MKTHILHDRLFNTTRFTLCGYRAKTNCAVMTIYGNWSLEPNCEICVLLHFQDPYNTYGYNWYKKEKVFK